MPNLTEISPVNINGCRIEDEITTYPNQHTPTLPLVKGIATPHMGIKTSPFNEKVDISTLKGEQLPDAKLFFDFRVINDQQTLKSCINAFTKTKTNFKAYLNQLNGNSGFLNANNVSSNSLSICFYLSQKKSTVFSPDNLTLSDNATQYLIDPNGDKKYLLSKEFLRTYGDHYVKSCDLGVGFLGVIKIDNLDTQKIQNFKSKIDATADITNLADIAADAGLTTNKKSTQKNKNCTLSFCASSGITKDLKNSSSMVAMSLDDALDVINDALEIAKKDDFALKDLDTLSMSCGPWTDLKICCLASQTDNDFYESSFRSFAQQGAYSMAAQPLFKIGDPLIIKNLIDEYKDKPRLFDILYGLKIMMKDASRQQDVNLCGRIKKFAKDNFPRVAYQIMFRKDYHFKVTNNYNPINGQKSFMSFGCNRALKPFYDQKHITVDNPNSGFVEQYLKIKADKSGKYINFTIANGNYLLYADKWVAYGVLQRNQQTPKSAVWEIIALDNKNINISPVNYPTKLLYASDNLLISFFRGKSKKGLCLSKKDHAEKEKYEWELVKSKTPAPTLP